MDKIVPERLKYGDEIRVVINADFGHTTPVFTFPIGGYANIQLDNEIKIEIL